VDDTPTGRKRPKRRRSTKEKTDTSSTSTAPSFVVLERAHERYFSKDAPLPILRLSTPYQHQFADLSVAIIHSGSSIGDTKIESDSTNEVITVANFSFSNVITNFPVPFYFVILLDKKVIGCSQPCFITANALTDHTQQLYDAIEKYEPPKVCKDGRANVRWTTNTVAALAYSTTVYLRPGGLVMNRKKERPLGSNSQSEPIDVVPSNTNDASVSSTTLQAVLRDGEAELLSSNRENNTTKGLLCLARVLGEKEDITVQDIVSGLVGLFSREN